MSYGPADTSPKVGYRPYGETDAHGASRLSGLGQASNPFKPYAWHLGQLRPLDPWELSGLGGLGDSYGNAGDDNMVASAADELLAAGTITQAEHDAIYNGSMNFMDVLGIDPTDQTSWLNAVQLARAANAALTAKEQEFAANAPPPGSSPNPAYAAIGQQLIQMRQQYTDTTSKLVYYYTLVMGSAPTGLSGLGIAPVVYWVAGIAVFIVGAILLYKQIQNNAASISVQKQVAAVAQTVATTCQTLAQQLQAAQAAGDTITANSLAAALKACTGSVPAITPGGGAQPAGFATWFEQNFQWVALALVAVVVAGPIAQGAFGGRR